MDYDNRRGRTDSGFFFNGKTMQDTKNETIERYMLMEHQSPNTKTRMVTHFLEEVLAAVSQQLGIRAIQLYTPWQTFRRPRGLSEMMTLCMSRKVKTLYSLSSLVRPPGHERTSLFLQSVFGPSLT
ncbi:uncharacterized protein LOC122255534 [Penaeus japonicus]|uniref:uncharacterized protein LOC122255534 n=1 Tax=Penaeus japonicus TaxID=27405 RepID=UPI001C71231F|nr:uncharacterized protein LOC122255534 [Penaeus japonicus]